MTATTALGGALAIACGAIQLAVTLRLRPDVHRAGELKPTPSGGAGRPTPGALLERIGRTALSLLCGRGRRPGGRDSVPDIDAVSAQGAGAALVSAICLAPLGPWAAIGAGAAGWLRPHLRRRRLERGRLAAIAADLPEVVDLMALALAAGLNVSLAVEAVGRRGTGPLAREMQRVANEASRGRRLADALEDLARRCGEPTRPLMSLLAAGERYGVPLVQSLDRLATDVRASQRRRAEEAARRLPVKMLFPLVVCILPAFALLTLGPLLLTSLQSLSW